MNEKWTEAIIAWVILHWYVLKNNMHIYHKENGIKGMDNSVIETDAELGRIWRDGSWRNSDILWRDWEGVPSAPLLTREETLMEAWNTNLDAARPWQKGFQDTATPIMEGIVELHDRIMWYLIIILIVVSYMLIRIIMIFKENKISNKYSNHGTMIEIIWTIIPAMILISISLPSFRLLYLMDETIDAAVTVKVIGKQWYWTYEIADIEETVTFDSYMKPTEDLEMGELRLLEVDNILKLPISTNIRILVTGGDVIHSFAVPSLGIKVDAIPGRLNQISTFIKRPGTYYGQCSELCGVQHGFMPIVIKGVDIKENIEWIKEKISENS